MGRPQSVPSRSWRSRCCSRSEPSLLLTPGGRPSPARPSGRLRWRSCSASATTAAFATVLLIVGASALTIAVGRRSVPFAVAGASLATLGLWIRLDLAGVNATDAYVAPVAVALATAGFLARRQRPRDTRELSSWVAYGPAIALLGAAALAERLAGGAGMHALVAGTLGTVAVAVGGWKRLAGPLLLGTTLLAAVVLSETLAYTATMPTWGWLALAGARCLRPALPWSEPRSARSRPGAGCSTSCTTASHERKADGTKTGICSSLTPSQIRTGLYCDGWVGVEHMGDMHMTGPRRPLVATRILPILAALTALVMLTAACSSSSDSSSTGGTQAVNQGAPTDEGPPQDGGTLRVAVGADIDGLVSRRGALVARRQPHRFGDLRHAVDVRRGPQARAPPRPVGHPEHRRHGVDDQAAARTSRSTTARRSTPPR